MQYVDVDWILIRTNRSQRDIYEMTRNILTWLDIEKYLKIIYFRYGKSIKAF